MINRCNYDIHFKKAADLGLWDEMLLMGTSDQFAAEGYKYCDNDDDNDITIMVRMTMTSLTMMIMTITITKPQ